MSSENGRDRLDGPGGFRCCDGLDRQFHRKCFNLLSPPRKQQTNADSAVGPGLLGAAHDG